MKKLNIFMILLMSATLILSGCSNIKNNNVGMANPASTFCVENGGTLKIRNSNDGQYGVCTFPNGKECDEWKFFRGECTKELNEDKFCGGIAGVECDEGFTCKLDGNYPDAGGICIEEESLICTMEYNPVCGIDGNTYGNPCMAQKTEVAYMGECGTENAFNEPKKCTKEYMPVCGADGVTYGNKCMAGNINIVSEGPCSDSNDKETNSEKIFCTEEQKSAEICTMEYMPVCGNDGVTYGNKCSACGSKNIDYYTLGECTIIKESDNYKLIEMNGKKIENSNAEITFDISTNDMSGNAGCNRMFSKFELNDDTITFGPIGSTMMYCEESMNIETELLNILNSGKLRLEYKDNLLNMYSNDSLILVWKEN